MRVRPQAVPFEMDRPNLHAGSKRDRALLTRFRLLCPLELAGEFIRPGQGRLISEGRHQDGGAGGIGRCEGAPGDRTTAAAFPLAVRLLRRRAATTMPAPAIALLRVQHAIVRIH
jgi:hypothetical protein